MSSAIDQKPQIYFKQQPIEDDNSDIEFLEDSSTIIDTPRQSIQLTRQVPSAAYQYGYSHRGQPNSRIIVDEEYDKSLCRQYFKARGDIWYCMGCGRVDKKQARTKGQFNGQLFEAPLSHSCVPQTKASAIKEQESIKRKLNNIGGATGADVLLQSIQVLVPQQPDSRKRSRTAAKVCPCCPGETPCSTKRVRDRQEKIQNDDSANQLIATLNESRPEVSENDENAAIIPEETVKTQENESTTATVHETTVKTPISMPSFYEILKNNKYFDVIITSSDGQIIQTHRNIMSTFSTVLDKAFSESTKLPVKVTVEEFDCETVQAAIDFCYGKPDSIEGKESKLFQFAVKYDIQILKEACLANVKDSVTAVNVCELIQIAYANNFEELKEICLKVLVEKKSEIPKLALSTLPSVILVDAFSIC